MIRDRSANAVVFGFDFQVNAAILLMLENIKNLSSLRLESHNEDIDLELFNGKHILAQAKSVVKSSTDFKNVRVKLKAALKSLSEGNKNVDVEKLIYITNSYNPFNDDESKNIFWGETKRPFSLLPNTSKKIIRDYLSDIENPLDENNFYIHFIPFETDNDDERYKAILNKINEFIGDLKLDIPGIGKQLHSIWRNDIFSNGSKKNCDIKLSKKSIIWPIIVIATDVERVDSDFLNLFDCVLYDEIIRKYKTLINSYCDRVEFFTKILYDFKLYDYKGTGKEKLLSFIESCSGNYTYEFTGEGVNPEIIEGLTKVVVYNVVRRRFDIDRIKNGVNL